MELAEEKIAPLLTGELGRQLVIYKTIDSTNRAARLLAKNGAAHGAAVLALQQTAGKGRLGRSFYSPPGAGIYLSVILRLPLAAQDLLLLTPAAAVAGARAIEEVCGLSVRIKWVNDLYWQGKKLCGILCESSFGQNGRAQETVVGIGINVKEDSFPPELRDKATSLMSAGAEEVDQNRLAAALLNHLDRLCKLPSEEWMGEYRARSCVLGKKVVVMGAGEPYEALAISIDKQARLEVRTNCGDARILSTGEISLRGDFS